VNRAVLTALAILCDLMGLLWIGQGLGYVRGSFMTGQPVWAAIGAVLLGVSALLYWIVWRPRA